MNKAWGVLAAGFAVAVLSGTSWAEGKKESVKADDAGGLCSCPTKKGPLGMTEEQRKAFKEAAKARKEAVKPLRKQLKEEARELRELLRDEAKEDKIQASLSRIEKLRDSIRAERERFRKKVESSLTPAQRAKMALRMLARAKQKQARGQGAFGRQGFGRGGHRGMQGRMGGWGEGPGGYEDEGYGRGRGMGRGRHGGGRGDRMGEDGERSQTED